MSRPTRAELLACFALPPTATFEEAQEAYRDMCQVWHPDRFEGNARLQAKATHAMREINEAWRLLRAHFSEEGRSSVT
jgi:curved DNA-binding protein CbpA